MAPTVSKKGALTWHCHDMIYDWVFRAKLQVGTMEDGLRKPGKVTHPTRAQKEGKIGINPYESFCRLSVSCRTVGLQAQDQGTENRTQHCQLLRVSCHRPGAGPKARQTE